MKQLISSVLSLSALTQLGCDPEPIGDAAVEERASVTSTDPAPLRRDTTPDTTLARLTFTNDAAGGFVAADSDTIRVDAEGLAVRLGKDTMRFTLRSWGRADRRETAELADPRLGACASEATTPGADCARRVEQVHGELTAWVARRAGAVEQGWTLAQRPAGAGPVELHLAVTGGEVLDVEDGAAELATTGVHWRYAGLKAWDAAGKALPAHLERTPEGLAVIVDDTDARYPIEIDPTLYADQVKLMALDPLQDPDWVQHAGKYNYGAATRDVGDLNNDGYYDVAVGAPLDYTWKNAAHTEICRRGGRVYLYYGSPLGIDPQSEQVLEPRGDGYIAYWEPQAVMDDIAPEEECTDFRFGADIAAGDFDYSGRQDLVIGAPSHNDAGVGGPTDSGRAWIYYNPAHPNIAAATPLYAPFSTQLQNRIGASVDAITEDWGSYGVASAPDASPLPGMNYYMQGAQWFDASDCTYGNSCTASELWSPDPFQDSRFGHRVRFLTNMGTAVAAPLHDKSGAVSSTVWDNQVNNLSTVLLANPQQDGYLFGWDIDDAGDVNGDGITDLIVGAPRNGNDKTGSAYLYLGAPSAPFYDGNAPIELKPAGVQPEDEYGTSVTGIGDINNDGFADLVIGSPNDGYYDTGVAYLYLGNASGQLGNNGIPFWPMEVKPNGFFGHRVSAAGYVNGDKQPDVMVSACDSYHQATADAPGESGETYYWCIGAVFVFTNIELN